MQSDVRGVVTISLGRTPIRLLEVIHQSAKYANVYANPGDISRQQATRGDK